MSLKLRGFAMTCLFFVGGFVGVLVFQLPRGDEAHWEPMRSAPDASAVESRRPAVGDVATAPARAGETAVSLPEPARVESKATGSEKTSPARDAAVPAAPLPGEVASDPIARIQQLSYATLSGDSRMKRLVALNGLSTMAYRGEELSQVKAALEYSMQSSDPVVAAQARSLYNQIKTGK